MGSRRVDCWGEGQYGQLGSGIFYDSALPVQVVTVGGSGALRGVSGLTSDGSGFCALTRSTELDCWGDGNFGQLGDGIFYTSGSNYGSAIPIQVLNVGGTGTLTGVSGLAFESGGYCAVLSSTGVDCWGRGGDGQLGDGVFYTNANKFGSALPVQVLGVGGSGALTGVSAMTSNAQSDGYCVLTGLAGVNCWGYGTSGELGDGYLTDSAVPVQVVGVAVRAQALTPNRPPEGEPQTPDPSTSSIASCQTRRCV